MRKLLLNSTAIATVAALTSATAFADLAVSAFTEFTYQLDKYDNHPPFRRKAELYFLVSQGDVQTCSFLTDTLRSSLFSRSRTRRRQSSQSNRRTDPLDFAGRRSDCRTCQRRKWSSSLPSTNQRNLWDTFGI